jgi:hypothetical protein
MSMLWAMVKLGQRPPDQWLRQYLKVSESGSTGVHFEEGCMQRHTGLLIGEQLLLASWVLLTCMQITFILCAT